MTVNIVESEQNDKDAQRAANQISLAIIAAPIVTIGVLAVSGIVMQKIQDRKVRKNQIKK